MPESDLLQILLSHDRWATTQVLDACSKLTDEQFHRRFEIGPGSLHDTLTHVVAVVRVMGESLSGRDPRPRLDTDGQRRTPGQLRALLEEAAGELAGEARRLPFDRTITRRTKDGRTLTMTRAAAFAHVTSHGMHHRAQCLNMLRHSGVTPLPPSSVAEWTWVEDKPA